MTRTMFSVGYGLKTCTRTARMAMWISSNKNRTCASLCSDLCESEAITKNVSGNPSWFRTTITFLASIGSSFVHTAFYPEAFQDFSQSLHVNAARIIPFHATFPFLLTSPTIIQHYTNPHGPKASGASIWIVRSEFSTNNASCPQPIFWSTKKRYKTWNTPSVPSAASRKCEDSVDKRRSSEALALGPAPSTDKAATVYQQHASLRSPCSLFLSRQSPRGVPARLPGWQHTR
jgi:hypothetical protein